MPVAEAADPLESRSLESIAPVEETAGVEPDDQGLENVGAEQTDEAPSSLSDGNEPAAPEVPQKSWRDVLTEKGFNLPQDADDASVAEQLAQSYQQTYQYAQQAALQQQRYQTELAQYQQQVAYFQQQQQAAQQQQQRPAPEPPKKSGPPEYKPEWENQIRWDAEKGRYVADPDIPYATVEKYVAYKDWQRERLKKNLEFDADEYKAQLAEQTKQEVQQQVHQVLETIQQQQRFQHAVGTAQSILDRHKDAFFQLDAQGNVLRDQFTGVEMLTPIGQKFHGYVNQVSQLGIAEPAMKAHLANALLHYEMYQNGQQQAPAQAAQQTQAQLTPQQQFLNKSKAATGGRPRGTQVANSLANGNPPPQNPSLDFKQMLERKFDEAGFR